ncbi:MCP four helix bundle domain-containing protein, partial [Acinetobacter baumannii]
GVLGLVGLRSTNAQMRSLYEDRLVAFSQLERMSAALDAARNGISTSIVGDSGDIDANMDRIEKAIKANDAIVKQYQDTQL